MAYTVTQLSRLAGVSPRTIRYYDQIGLLPRGRISTSGYRLYGPEQVDRLQQILFYRELGFALLDIRAILDDPAFDKAQALMNHRVQLVKRRDALNTLIQNVESSLCELKGGETMTDAEKFKGFKRTMIEENEKQYGKEAREKYGDRAMDASNDMVQNLTFEQHEEMTALQQTLMQKLAQAKAQGNPKSELAQKVADLHRQWLCLFWPQYTKQAHAALARMYVDDERFTAYYDKLGLGTAQFLHDAILIYTGMDG